MFVTCSQLDSPPKMDQFSRTNSADSGSSVWLPLRSLLVFQIYVREAPGSTTSTIEIVIELWRRCHYFAVIDVWICVAGTFCFSHSECLCCTRFTFRWKMFPHREQSVIWVGSTNYFWSSFTVIALWFCKTLSENQSDSLSHPLYIESYLLGNRFETKSSNLPLLVLVGQWLWRHFF